MQFQSATEGAVGIRKIKKEDDKYGWTGGVCTYVTSLRDPAKWRWKERIAQNGTFLQGSSEALGQDVLGL